MHERHTLLTVTSSQPNVIGVPHQRKRVILLASRTRTAVLRMHCLNRHWHSLGFWVDIVRTNALCLCWFDEEKTFWQPEMFRYLFLQESIGGEVSFVELVQKNRPKRYVKLLRKGSRNSRSLTAVKVPFMTNSTSIPPLSSQKNNMYCMSNKDVYERRLNSAPGSAWEMLECWNQCVTMWACAWTAASALTFSSFSKCYFLCKCLYAALSTA